MKRNGLSKPIQMSTTRLIVAVGCFLGALLLLVHTGISQPDLPFDFTVPQPPLEARAASTGEDSLSVIPKDEARDRILLRSRVLNDQASAPSERAPRERLVELPELPPEVAAIVPPLPELDPAETDEFAQ